MDPVSTKVSRDTRGFATTPISDIYIMLATLLAVLASICLVILTCGTCGKKKRAEKSTDTAPEERPAEESPQKNDSLDEDKSDHDPIDDSRARHIYFENHDNDAPPPEEDEFAFMRRTQPRPMKQDEEADGFAVFASAPAPVRPPAEP